MKNTNTMIKLSTALEKVFGGDLGTVIELLTNYNLGLTTVFSAAIGLVIGSAIYAMGVSKTK